MLAKNMLLVHAAAEAEISIACSRRRFRPECSKKFFSELNRSTVDCLGALHWLLTTAHGLLSLPVKVRAWVRKAGRAALVAVWAMVLARREARTRVEAIVSDGEEIGLNDRLVGQSKGRRAGFEIEEWRNGRTSQSFFRVERNWSSSEEGEERERDLQWVEPRTGLGGILALNERAQ